MSKYLEEVNERGISTGLGCSRDPGLRSISQRNVQLGGGKMVREGTGAVFPKDQSGPMTAEKLASVFQPDTLLSAQYFDNLRRKTLLEPEKRLMWAILEDAINCFQDNLSAETVKGKKLFGDAEEWILETDRDWIFSFDQVCEALGFNPEYVRHGLLRWKEKRRPKRFEEKTWERKKLAG